jgi:hypothetical protein
VSGYQIKGEEMTRYTMQLILDQWITPYIDTSSWEFFDLSCKARDDTEDKVLKDAVQAGKRVGSIFKEPVSEAVANCHHHVSSHYQCDRRSPPIKGKSNPWASSERGHHPMD